jgi:small subunit ribosomal protein S3Ae
MAVGKNKKTYKKKGGKKKVVDVFAKKEWYNVKAPAYFEKRELGKTPVNRTAGTKLAANGLRGRVFEVALSDLNNDDNRYRKFRLVCEEVHGRDILLNFHGMALTTDKLRSLVKKWQSLIETFVDVKTVDGYVLRIFVIGFTEKQSNSSKKTCYAQSAQQRVIRAKMREVVTANAAKLDLQKLVKRFITEQISEDIIKATKRVYPLHNVFLRKVKIIKKPKVDTAKLYELHGIISGKKGKGAASAGFNEPAPVDSV